MRWLTAGLMAALSVAAYAAPQPLWEVGLGSAVLIFNDYRGSATTHTWPLPLPYFIYRGNFLRSDRNGVRGRLFASSRVRLNLSANATTPVRNDSARRGMPDLRSTLELGPALQVRLLGGEHARLAVRIPAREAFTVEATPHMIGFFLAPNVSLDLAQYAGPGGWKLGLLAGPLFAQRRYDAYFYDVAPRYAAPGRPAFAARGGYAGTQFLVSLTRRYPRFWVGAYVRHDSLGGASFAASPLVQRDSYWTGGLGVAWIIARSSRLVESEE